MRAISCARQRRKGLLVPGGERRRSGCAAPPFVLFPVASSPPISVSHHRHRKLTKPGVRAEPGYLPGSSPPVVMWWDAHHHWKAPIAGIASRPRLRFSPLEIFAQRQLQPILSRILRRGSGLNPRALSLSSAIVDPFERASDHAARQNRRLSERQALDRPRHRRKMGNRIGPQPARIEAASTRRRPLILRPVLTVAAALARAGALWQGSARLVGPFWPILGSSPGHAAVAQW